LYEDKRPCKLISMLRIGIGYDSHRFSPQRTMWLGGVRIESEQGLAGHSDADAALHALTDAILGAIGAGDIGELFPDTDPRWHGQASSLFVERAVELASEKGFGVINCDLTIITERPTLGPYKAEIRKNIARLVGISDDRVGVKAKTNEGLGWIGRGEGLAVIAAVLLEGKNQLKKTPGPKGKRSR